jgi:hypothetical protein
MLEIGSSLREARRRQQLELAAVESATRIRTQQLQALEQERFELLPPDPYRRSFLREYADFLGLDGDLYAREYDLRFSSPEPTLPSTPPRRSTDLGHVLRARPLLVVSAVALAAIVVVSAWLLGRSGGTGTVPPTPATQVQTQTPHAQQRAAAAPTTSRTALPLVLTAVRGSCWLWVRSGSAGGPTVYEQTLQQGQTVRFGRRRPLWIRVGAPWNIDAAIGKSSLNNALPVRTGDVLVTTAGLRPAP